MVAGAEREQAPCYSFEFNSHVPQRAKPNMLPGQEPSTTPLIGPGAYNPKISLHSGQPFVREWVSEPKRQQSAFASKTQKTQAERPLTADIDIGDDFGERGSKKNATAAPGSHGLSWSKDVRKPPFFHVPFKPYPFEGGEPRGREIGLDVFYEVDTVSATPLALHATMAVNIQRSQRRYASTFKSKLPARPNPDSRGGSGELGPGSYTLHRSLRSSIRLLEPDRVSPWAIPYSGGKFRNVGKDNTGMYSDEARPPTPSSMARSWTERIEDEEEGVLARSRSPPRPRPGNIHSRLFNLSKVPSSTAHLGGTKPLSPSGSMGSGMRGSRPMIRAQSAPRLKHPSPWH